MTASAAEKRRSKSTLPNLDLPMLQAVDDLLKAVRVEKEAERAWKSAKTPTEVGTTRIVLNRTRVVAANAWAVFEQLIEGDA